MQKTINKRMAASGQVNGTNELHLMGVHLSATANASCIITEDGTGAGTAVLTVRVLANDSKFIDLSEMGGMSLSQAYATLAGAGVEAVLFYE